MLRRSRCLLLFVTLMLSLPWNANAAKAAMTKQPRQVDLSEAADQKRDELALEIQSLLTRISADKKNELRFRLAETYWEKSRFAYSLEYPKFDKAYQAWVDAGRKDSEPLLATFTSKTQKYRLLALAQYQSIVDSKANYARMDEVLFMLAFNQMEAGQKLQARANLKALVTKFPQSAFAADAQLVLGDDAFNANDLDKAQIAYQQAYDLGLKSEKTSTYVYALYKLAWVDFNLHDFASALEKFKQVVALSEQAATRFTEGSSSRKDAVQLQKEAVSDVVKSFAQLGDAKVAIAYFQDKAPKGELKSLTLRLAHAFHDQGNFAQEIATYQSLIADNTDPSATDYYAAILSAQASLNQYEAVAKTAQLIATRCKAPETPKTCEVAESNLRELATSYHKFAQAQHYQRDYEAAKSLYEAYLPTFTKSPDHSRLAFYYADLLWDIGDLEGAAKAYTAVVELNHKGENAVTAAMNSILAYEKIARHEARSQFENGRLKEPEKATPIKIQPENTPLTASDLALVKACDAYVALVEELGKTKVLQEDIMNTRYKAAYIYQSHFLSDDANARFFEIVKRWPQSKMAHDAVVLVLDGDDARKDWAKLKSHADVFAANNELIADKSLALIVRKFQEGAAFNLIASSKEPSAKDYEQFASLYKTSPLASSALYNALLIYRAQNNNDEVVRVGQGLLNNENAELSGTVTLAMAKAQENRGSFSEAASMYELFATNNKAKPESADMLYNAGILQLRAGNEEKAQALFEKHLKLYPGHKDSVNLLFSVAKLNEQRQNIVAATSNYETIVAAGSKADALQKLQARFALAKLDAKSCPSLVKAFDALQSEQKQNPDAKKGRAYCEFQQLEPALHAFENISLNVPPQKLQHQIAAKKAAMEKLAQAYVHILDFGDDEWGIAALYQAASSQIDYVNALRQIPDPKGLDADALKIFRDELENIVAPVESDAVQALEKALARAFELKVYTLYTRELAQSLSKFYPSKLQPFAWAFSPIADAPKETESLSRFKAEQSIAANKDLGAAYNILGQLELSHHRSSSAALAFSKGCDSKPESVSACANLGALALSFGDFKTASAAYQKAKTADPKTALWSMALGYSLAASGETDHAISELTTATAQNPGTKDAFACLCVVYRNQKSDPKKAKEWCDKYRGPNNVSLSDSDPMKTVITGLDAELKASTSSPTPNGGVH